MNAFALPVLSDQQWHDYRAKHVGASEVSALFGLSPYMSRWTLWHIKARNIPAPEIDGNRIRWGNRMEQVIAKGIAKDNGWKVRKTKRYLCHPKILGMGASLDFEILDHPKGMGVLEVKNVDRSIFSTKWDEQETFLEAPMHIELQVQHQLAVSGYQWGAIGVLVGGNEAKYTIRERHQGTINKIEDAVGAFWESIAKGDEPPVEDAGDLALMTSLFKGYATVGMDASFDVICKKYQAAQAEQKKAASTADAIKVELVNLLNGSEAEIGIGDEYQASYKLQTRAAHTVKESTFRVLRINQLKGKDQ